LNTLTSCADLNSLRDILNTCYPVHVDQIHLHRDMIGYVYIAEGATKRGPKKYVLKLYRPYDTENALCSIGILEYLRQQDYPVVSIVPTRADVSHVVIDTPQGMSVAILFDYLDGPEPHLKTEIVDLARQVGLLHQTMETYPHPPLHRGKDFYVDRYLGILQALCPAYHHPAKLLLDDTVGLDRFLAHGSRSVFFSLEMLGWGSISEPGSFLGCASLYLWKAGTLDRSDGSRIWRTRHNFCSRICN